MPNDLEPDSFANGISIESLSICSVLSGVCPELTMRVPMDAVLADERLIVSRKAHQAILRGWEFF
jgi:hypothetical protein